MSPIAEARWLANQSPHIVERFTPGGRYNARCIMCGKEGIDIKMAITEKCPARTKHER